EAILIYRELCCDQALGSLSLFPFCCFLRRAACCLARRRLASRRAWLFVSVESLAGLSVSTVSCLASGSVKHASSRALDGSSPAAIASNRIRSSSDERSTKPTHSGDRQQ